MGGKMINVVALALAICLGAAGVVANELSARATELAEQLKTTQASARTAWGKVYAMEDAQTEAAEALSNAVTFAKWEVEEACRKGMIK